MGLDTTHGCWHGAYSSFAEWRGEIAKAAGLPTEQEEGHWSGAPIRRYEVDEQIGEGALYGDWDSPPADPIWVLLAHSDCEGKIPHDLAGPLADRLEALVPKLPPDDPDLWWGHRIATKRFVDGLRKAATAGEAVEFH